MSLLNPHPVLWGPHRPRNDWNRHPTLKKSDLLKSFHVILTKTMYYLFALFLFPPVPAVIPEQVISTKIWPGSTRTPLWFSLYNSKNIRFTFMIWKQHSKEEARAVGECIPPISDIYQSCSNYLQFHIGYIMKFPILQCVLNFLVMGMSRMHAAIFHELIFICYNSN